MIGMDENSGLSTEQASDLSDERISFVKKLMRAAPDNSFISLVNLSDRHPHWLAVLGLLMSCELPKAYCSTPTQDRQETECGLDALEYGEDGLTPLNGVLKEVLTNW